MVNIYIGFTVFVDHYSNFDYVHFMYKLYSEATVEANLAFERICDSYGVIALNYHADNGLSETKRFKEV